MYTMIGLFVFVGIAVLFSIFAFWRAGQLRDLFNKWPEVDKVVEDIANTMDKAQKDTIAQYERSAKDAQVIIAELKRRLGIQ